ncbi:hypothetical protein IB642_07175 [Allofrancisella guangzhouensis]|uniref:hypothetical protein n=1 Tax=Allofrancisella guangzhouensis TaxID=594679 RepID=UPI000B08B003|nr:hypothetical protein [Allofrancisella guangzhouensis]MBK2027808.1 hypothetical protein [Allofrancisella guangzhouensis]MBK2044798.1 hypothetical protein [Allofrancisella guangzhouensis]MBK2045751.1 hypothetical protein [Allofrancisella guangzhouensis]
MKYLNVSGCYFGIKSSLEELRKRIPKLKINGEDRLCGFSCDINGYYDVDDYETVVN